jgi:GTP-binding protein EngB required for normal cell division
MKWNELEQEAGHIKENLISLFEGIKRNTSTLLPERGADFDHAEEVLKKPNFDVVVCGEVKKGKSSFINAIIGADILPTNTEVATSQVFRISNEEKESYALVFTDGSQRAITREELVRYGSQVAADKNGDPIFGDKTLDYISIGYPIAFLPKEVTLVDTPGIGAVYAAHEQITMSYLVKAAAVIFIMDPSNPLVDSEKAFIEKALGVTRQIMFVMTKMDNYDMGYITTMVRRNEEILAPLQEKTYNKQIQILPMSSKTLFEAAAEDIDVLREDGVQASQFDKVREELMKLVYSTVAISRNAYAFNVANSYNTAVMSSLGEQRKVLDTPSTETSDVIAKKNALRQEFTSNWGPSGAKQRQIVAGVKEQITGLQHRVESLFSTSGPIYRQFEKEINELQNLEQDKQYGESLGSRVSDAIGTSWKQILDSCQTNIQELLVGYDREASSLIQVDASEESSLMVVEDFQFKGMSAVQQFQQLRNGYYTVAFAAMLVGSLIPVGGWVIIGLGTLLGLFQSRTLQHKNCQEKLKQCLGNNFRTMYNSLCKDPKPNKTTLEQIIEDLSNMSQDALQKIYERQKATIEKSLAVLNEQQRKQGAEREAAKHALQELQTSWKPLYDKLLATRSMIDQLVEKLETNRQ